MDLEPYLFDNLYIAKQLWDAGAAERFLKWCGSYPVDTEEYYELFYDGVASVFEETKTYYNEEKEIETLVLFDPLMDEFFRLCEEYERLKGVSPADNQLRRGGQREVCNSFGFVDYCCDWWLFDEQHGRSRLVILFDCNFCGHHELPGAVANARNELKNQISQLKSKIKALASNKKPKCQKNPPVKMLTEVERKEAA